MWHGIPMAPTAGSAPACRLKTRSRSRSRLNLVLLHLLADDAGEREQPLVDRGRDFADEPDDAPSVLENPGFPHQLIAEFVDPRLVRRRRVLQRLQSQRVVANLFG